MNKYLTPRFMFISSLILLAALTRLIPHLYNFTAIAGIALFGGAKFNNKFLSFGIPLFAMFITDAIIGFHSQMMVVYSCFAFTVLLGWMIRNRQNVLSVVSASLFSSIVFYLVTNFAVWPGNPAYAQNLSGLMTSYFAGIPFFRNELLGDLFFNTVLFGGFYIAQLRFPFLSNPDLGQVKN